MHQLPLVLAWLALHFAIGSAGTWLARRYALRRQLLDLPDARRSHAQPTPRGGGIAIVCAVLLAMAIVGHRYEGLGETMLLLGTGLVLVAGIGWLDDHRPLSPWPRLAVQSIAAALLAFAMHRAGASPMLLSAGFLAAMVLVNVWNFMDGIDGIAASQAVLVAVGLALLAMPDPMWWIGLALAAAAGGFLPFNFPRARIFLGDVGSGAIGYILACLLAGLWLLASDLGLRLLALLPLLPFLLDASLTLVARILNGERWWTPHVQHAYQCSARRLGRHWPVTFVYALATLMLLAFMYRARFASLPFIIVMMSACCLAGVAIWWRLRAPPRRPNSDPSQGTRG